MEAGSLSGEMEGEQRGINLPGRERYRWEKQKREQRGINLLDREWYRCGKQLGKTRGNAIEE